ncbi:hypothetical protein FOA52_005355 [Chlamydomonas sp. UWO 241]|nr:hypothetical protein FOA52_005355 [Chlamydomonas sp. UWO 241]
MAAQVVPTGLLGKLLGKFLKRKDGEAAPVDDLAARADDQLVVEQGEVSDPALKRPKLDQPDGADTQPCTRPGNTEEHGAAQPAQQPAETTARAAEAPQDPESLETGALKQAQALPDASTCSSSAPELPAFVRAVALPLLPAVSVRPEDLITPRENVIECDDVGAASDQGQQAAGEQEGAVAPRPQEEVVVEAAACVGYCSVQNNRPYQEDRAKVLLDHGTILGGMFDGHAGLCTSTFLQEHLLGEVSRRMRDGMPCSDALHASFKAANTELRKLRSSYMCGSTATVVVVNGREVTCANAGDSPAFIVTSSGAVTRLTVDHAPSCEGERARIEAAGGRIQKMGWGGNQQRVLSHDNLSGLAMTRAFGDFNFVGVICDPHISHARLGDDAMYLVMASDGLTERWTVEGAAAAVAERAASVAGATVADMASMLSARAIETGSRDNITIVVLDLRKYLQALPDGQGGGASGGD